MEKSRIDKIIVSPDNELTDIVRAIKRSDAEKIILTFADKSDLLISPVNLKVIQEICLKNEKLLIAQVIQNPTGIRNCMNAGIKTIETASNPTEDDWDDAVRIFEKAAKPNKKKEDIEKVVEDKKNISTFEQRVNTVINRSRDLSTINKEIEEKDIESDEIEIIDNSQDTSEDDEYIKIDEDISKKKDIPQEVEEKVVKPLPSKDIKKDLNNSLVSFKNRLAIFFRKIRASKYFGILPKLIIPLILVLVGGAFAYYKLIPFVKVTIFVEAKPVSIEKVFTGDANISEIDFSNLKIPIKTGDATKSLSDTVTATGKAYKGNKSTGTVRITYIKGADCTSETPKITLNTGQTVSTTNLSFKLKGSAELSCNSMTDVEVEAADIGEEYNIASNKSFSVQGYASTEVYGLNSAAFTGGSKQEYTVLSQQDVNTAVESLSTTAIEEVKSQLRENAQGWEIIENSIKSEVEKSSIKTDKAIGAEATEANLELTIKGTATYYSTNGLNEGLSDMLTISANEQNLFESSSNLDLVLSDDIQKTIKIDDNVKDSVRLIVNASANVKPKVDKTDIENNLKTKKWNEGLQYLSDLTFAKQNTEVSFNPNWIPDYLRYFPTRKGGILITVVELTSK